MRFSSSRFLKPSRLLVILGIVTVLNLIVVIYFTVCPYHCRKHMDVKLSLWSLPRVETINNTLNQAGFDTTSNTLNQAGVDTINNTMNQAGVDTISNALNQAGVEVSEQELLLRTKKLPFNATLLSKEKLLEHPYFSLRSPVVEQYTNSILRQPDSTCGQAVHIIVLSHPRDVTTRRAIRETWGSVAKGRPWPGKALSLPVTLTFVLGTESPQKHSLSSINGTALSSADKEKKSCDETIQSQANGGRPCSQPEEDIESDLGNILQFDMFDSYANLTRKVLSALDWITSACKGVQYIVKVNQDIFLNILF
ncbi:hexosyltransferase [Plakobranchus ocellatus]|uniref:Hexosyltransferase n=1 Tax=Plakobranchus ocellatus TaxID=259542 RepID=A0AAV4CND2_9GAST|nr:hexosyltransferase [Plakobranchus ocellatus]